MSKSVRYLFALFALIGAALTQILAKEFARGAGVQLGAAPLLLLFAPWLFLITRLLWNSPDEATGSSTEAGSTAPLSNRELIDKLKAAASNRKLSASTRDEAQRRLNELLAGVRLPVDDDA